MRRLLLAAALVGSFTFGACVGDDNVNPNDGGADSTATDAAADVPASDASTDAATDGDAGAWSPQVLDQQGALALWLDTTDSNNIVISSGHVEQWTDRSANHNNAVNPSTGPTLNASALNGYSSIHFAAHGVTLSIADATSLQFSNDQILIMAVAKESTTGLYFFSKHTSGFNGGGGYFKTGIEFYGLKGPFDGGSETAPFAHYAEDPTDSGTATVYSQTWDGQVFDDGNFHIVGVRRPNSGELTLLVDGLPPQSNTNVGGYDVSEVGQPVEVGSVAYGNNNPAMDGEIVEIIAVHETVIPDSVVTNLQTYLKAKYNL